MCNPDDDLPHDFEARQAEHYASLRKPLDPAAFIAGLREEMRTELDALHDALPRLDWLQIAGRREGAIKLTPLDAAPDAAVAGITALDAVWDGGSFVAVAAGAAPIPLRGIRVRNAVCMQRPAPVRRPL